MIEVICAVVTFLATQVLLHRYPIKSKLRPVRDVGVCIAIMLLTVVLVAITSPVLMPVVIIVTVACGAYMSTKYRGFLSTMKKPYYPHIEKTKK
jgi:hypothetical protein